MAALLTALIAFLMDATDLTAVTGRGFTARVTDVWNLPSSVTFPLLSLSLERDRDPVRGIVSKNAPTRYTMRCWYVTDGSNLEAVQFRDALRTKLNLQQVALAAAGVFVYWIEMTASRVMQLGDINKHEAYLEFSVVA